MTLAHLEERSALGNGDSGGVLVVVVVVSEGPIVGSRLSPSDTRTRIGRQSM